MEATIPELPKLVGGALIAVGIGGTGATIANGLKSTPLIIAVWLIALFAGIAMIAYVERKKKKGIGTETTTLAVIDVPNQGDGGTDDAGSPVASGARPERPPQESEVTSRIGLEAQSPWEDSPTSEIYTAPPSHSRILDAQSGGDFLVWTPDPTAETDLGSEPRVLKLPPGKWLHIGRSPKSDIQFSMAYTPISRRHAAVKLSEPGILLVRDLGSLNGTWVNGESVADHCRHNGVKAMPVRADADLVVGGAAVSYGWRRNRDEAQSEPA